jgi:short-subunit dehydrogenase
MQFLWSPQPPPPPPSPLADSPIALACLVAFAFAASIALLLSARSNGKILTDKFAGRFGSWVVVAGSSEGIGAEFSRLLAAQGLNLVLIARREQPLRKLADELKSAHQIKVKVLPLDLGTDEAVTQLSNEIARLDVGLLVYNACASCICNFAESPPEALDAIISTNCRGLVRFARLLAPRLADRPQGGGLLLMSSMSGFTGHATAAVYAASKAFTTSLGQGLWAELEPCGVTVRVCAAGATNTPSFLSVTPEDKRQLALPMDAYSVAKFALQSLERRGSRGALVIPGALNRFAAFLMKRVLGPTEAVNFMSSNLKRIYGIS